SATARRSCRTHSCLTWQRHAEDPAFAANARISRLGRLPPLGDEGTQPSSRDQGIRIVVAQRYIAAKRHRVKSAQRDVKRVNRAQFVSRTGDSLPKQGWIYLDDDGARASILEWPYRHAVRVMRAHMAQNADSRQRCLPNLFTADQLEHAFRTRLRL